MITIEWAKDPKYIDSTGQAIDLIVKFAEFPDSMPFCATSYDSQDYGRLLYANAVAGQYGPVAPYVPPPEPNPPLEQPSTSGTQNL